TLEGRNADLFVAGLEANLAYEWSEAMSAFLNTSIVVTSSLTPKQRRDETDAAWEYLPLNATVRNGRYPDFMAHGGVNLRPAGLPVNINVAASLVGARRATSVNQQLFSYLDLSKTYTLSPYLAGSLHVSTRGLRLLAPLFEGETNIPWSARYIPGGAIEPGYGGLDIPSTGPAVFLRLEQHL